MRIVIPPNYPSESLVLFVFSTWHVLMALLVSRRGVLRREEAARSELKRTEAPAGAEMA